MGSLNDRQFRFCVEYIKDLNGKQAAIRAGYSPRTAEVQSSRLLNNVKTRTEIDKLLEEKNERTKIDADWLHKRLADEIDANVRDLYTENGELRPMRDWPDIWCKGLVAGITTNKFGGMEVKLSDRAKRLEMLGKHVNVQAFKDNVEVSGKLTIEDLVVASRREKSGEE